MQAASGSPQNRQVTADLVSELTFPKVPAAQLLAQAQSERRRTGGAAFSEPEQLLQHKAKLDEYQLLGRQFFMPLFLGVSPKACGLGVNLVEAPSAKRNAPSDVPNLPSLYLAEQAAALELQTRDAAPRPTFALPAEALARLLLSQSRPHYTLDRQALEAAGVAEAAPALAEPGAGATQVDAAVFSALQQLAEQLTLNLVSLCSDDGSRAAPLERSEVERRLRFAERARLTARTA